MFGDEEWSYYSELLRSYDVNCTKFQEVSAVMLRESVKSWI